MGSELDYKKIIKNQEARLKILRLFDFIPDKLMVKLQYRIKTGRRLNLKNPTRFTEKIQWYKLYYHDHLMTQCADKYSVREYIAQKGLEDILVPLYGVYENVEDIAFDVLPNKFVLKTTNGSHTNIICEDKERLDIEETKKLIHQWLNTRPVKMGREWAYYNIKPRIVCEEYLQNVKDGELIDYKFYCFKGGVAYIRVIKNKNSSDGCIVGIFDNEFKQAPYYRKDYKKLKTKLEKPKSFERMLEIAKILSSDFPHVRADFYNIDGKIYFGELTFYESAGYSEYDPDEFDFILGNQFELPVKME